MTTFLERCQDVIEKYPKIAAALFDIRTQEEGITKLVANPVQEHYHAERVRRGYSAGDDVLKDRKRGISTWKELEGLALALYVEGWTGGVVVHEKDTAERLFKILRFAYERLPSDIRRDRPLNEDRRDAMQIGDSSIYVYTASARGVGRSETFHWLHCTEVAHWNNPEGALAGLLEAVPRFGYVCKESTPNGRENFWYDECLAAKEGRTGNKLFFYEWWWGPENSLPLEPGEVIVPTEEEEFVIQIAAKGGFRISREQLKWRRRKKADPVGGKIFAQEHPEDFETCFLVSGNLVHDGMLLARYIQQAEAAFTIEKVWTPGGGESITWRRRLGSDPFIVSVDVGEGKANSDWSIINVWQNHPDHLFNCKRTKLRCPPDQLAVLAVQECREFDNALLVVERNSIGGEVVRKVDALGYGNQYRLLDRDGHMTEHLGWQTNDRTKRQAVEQFAGDVEAGAIVSFDPELWGQALNIVRDDLGKPVFPKKKNDDIYVSAIIANAAKEQATRYSGATVVSYA